MKLYLGLLSLCVVAGMVLAEDTKKSPFSDRSPVVAPPTEKELAEINASAPSAEEKMPTTVEGRLERLEQIMRRVERSVDPSYSGDNLSRLEYRIRQLEQRLDRMEDRLRKLEARR